MVMCFIEADGLFQWSCDHCNDSVEFPANNFWDRWGELKARGWRAYYDSDHDGQGWRHQCGKCKHKHQQTNWMDRTFSKPREVK
jgi:hypothetical protein